MAVPNEKHIGAHTFNVFYSYTAATSADPYLAAAAAAAVGPITYGVS